MTIRESFKTFLCVCVVFFPNGTALNILLLLISRYLQEYQPLGTVGGIYHFRDQISFGNPEGLVVINADISCDFPFQELLEFHKNHPGKHTIMATEVS